MEQPETSGEPEAIAIAAFAAKCNENATRTMGLSASMLEVAILDVGVFDDGDDNTYAQNPNNRQLQGIPATGVRPRHPDGDIGDNLGIASVPKKRKVFERLKKEDCLWWRRYLNTESKAIMELDPEGRVATKFRRNFRVPYSLYKTQVLALAKERWWPQWHADKVDACLKPVADLELKLLGALYVVGTGNSQFQVSEKTDISEEVHRCFYIDWLAKMKSVKDEFIYFPQDDEAYQFIVEEYAAMGLPGCIGSVDCVHVGWDKCPSELFNLYKGKEHFPSVAYEVVCTNRKFIQSVSCGHPGARNDKHIARTDKAITNLLSPHDWLGSKSWEVVYDATGRKKVFHGSYLLCDGGYHRWPCLVYPVKTGAPGSPARKWAAMIESVRKDIEGVFGILKSRFAILKHFNRMHHQRDVDNVFVTCCILHNMLLKDNGYLAVDLPLYPHGLTKVLRKMFANVSLDGVWNRGDDDTPDEQMEIEERRQCPLEKTELAHRWTKVMEGLMNHYQFAT